MKVMQGTVTSAKNEKTVTVSVVRKWQHPLYKKYVKRTKKYACHVEDMKLVEGDVVTIVECRPMSKTKRFKVVERVGHKVAKVEAETEVAAEVKTEKAAPKKATKTEKKAKK